MIARAALLALATMLATSALAAAQTPRHVYPAPQAPHRAYPAAQAPPRAYPAPNATPRPQVITAADHHRGHYGFNRSPYAYGWFGAKYHARMHVHHGYSGECYSWCYGRGY